MPIRHPLAAFVALLALVLAAAAGAQTPPKKFAQPATLREVIASSQLVTYTVTGEDLNVTAGVVMY